MMGSGNGDAAALAYRRRIHWIDRLARGLISLSGFLIIGAVLAIGVFLVVEVLPLLQGARVELERGQSVLPADQPALLAVADEYQGYAMVFGREPIAHIVPLAASQTDIPTSIPIPDLTGHRLTTCSRNLDDTLAIGTDQGAVWLGTAGFSVSLNGAQRKITPDIQSTGLIELMPGQSISRLTYRGTEDRGTVAAMAGDGSLVVIAHITTQHPLIGPARVTHEVTPLPLEVTGPPTAMVLDQQGKQLLVGTAQGQVHRWRLSPGGPPELIESVEVFPGASVTVMAYLLGDRSVAVGASDGRLAGWSLVRDARSPDGWRLTRLHTFQRHHAPLATITPSPRDKRFLSWSEDGVGRLHYMTSEQTLAEVLHASGPSTAAMTPKANGIVMVDVQGVLHHWLVDNPHPELSWQGLFGKLWYEGYEEPAYIWQSSSATDDSEPKLSLVPLIFGTLKGTWYAMLLAVPIALFGALYCSQFLDKRWRAPVKSTIELMAALPSVVLGFIAGVFLAPLIQRWIVAVLIMPVLVPLIAIGGRWGGARLMPWLSAERLRRHELWVLVAWISLGALASLAAGPWIERTVFQGSFETWLMHATGQRYDQRNALVVGWAMGFAVIPVIFTMCEDAFSAVPRHLVGASLACGASAWQTAWHVVLPAAGSGVFSAVMVGFGRAVGETMIVLMATGNTPIMDWSFFNGFRTLSANIAVEIPEAPYGGTLYRVLFVAALLLFGMTFAVNTTAEVVRLRLRKRLQGL